jgi:hypothetical protein
MMQDSSVKADTYPLAAPPDPLENLKPLSRAESRRCYQQPNREFDALEHHLAGLPSPLPDAD